MGVAYMLGEGGWEDGRWGWEVGDGRGEGGGGKGIGFGSIGAIKSHRLRRVRWKV